MKKYFYLIFFGVFLFSGCNTWLIVEDIPEEKPADQEFQMTYEMYTSGFKTCDIGYCVVCGNPTSSGSIKYCPFCWNNGDR